MMGKEDIHDYRRRLASVLEKKAEQKIPEGDRALLLGYPSRP